MKLQQPQLTDKNFYSLLINNNLFETTAISIQQAINNLRNRITSRRLFNEEMYIDVLETSDIDITYDALRVSSNYAKLNLSGVIYCGIYSKN